MLLAKLGDQNEIIKIHLDKNSLCEFWHLLQKKIKELSEHCYTIILNNFYNKFLTFYFHWFISVNKALLAFVQLKINRNKLIINPISS